MFQSSVSRAGLLLLLWVMTGGCSKPAETRAMDDGLFPFKPGARWQYYAAKTVPGVPATDSVMQTWVDGVEIIDGKSYSRVINEVERLYDRNRETFFFRNAPEGIYRIDDKHRQFGEYLDMPRPLAVGTKWTVKGPVLTLEYEVESLADASIVNDQEYRQCWRIRYKGSTNQPPFIDVSGTVFRFPGVGEVQSTMRMNVDSTTQTLEQQLARYQAPGTDGLRTRN